MYQKGGGGIKSVGSHHSLFKEKIKLSYFENSLFRRIYYSQSSFSSYQLKIDNVYEV